MVGSLFGMWNETEITAPLKKVSLGVSSHRYAICKKCPHMKKWSKVCKVCGCFLLAKVEYEAESCPIGKW